ncbi:MAG: NADH-quinone oxidoreductase subunit L [Anaerolineales bacterium]|nr:NADH-quinone oxidoreductase subunit L [Anaerolineales bacterium]
MQLDATTLTWLIPVPPLLAFFLIVLFTNRSKWLSHTLAVGLMLVSWMMSWGVLTQVVSREHFGAEGTVIEAFVNWLPFGGEGVAGAEPFNMGVLVDPLTGVMLFFVPLICLMIFIYSVGYHNFLKPVDPHAVPGEPAHNGVEPLYARFFAYLSLFAFGMLVLVVADNLLLMFMGWEIMGLCSFLLIGFWYARVYPNPQQITPRQAAVKAFITTRIADVVMLLGIAYLYAATGTLSFREIMFAHEGEILARLAETPSFIAGLSAAGLIGLLLLTGTVGKSAQFPLHTWLPDAMEGPTPVSAMIHAAAMVSAGVYAMIRVFPILSAGWHEGGPLTPPMLVIGTIGAFTALFAATIAVAQNDVKKVLAYSTISQLGFMLAALGIGGYVAAAFHLMTHAFFKALLFLGSGSIIHGMEHGMHQAHDHHTDPQDMRFMGGLRTKMPVTFWTFLIGGFALAGFPLITAGFWSKDEILADAWAHAPIVFYVLAFAALLTAFYTMRQITMVFFGKPRTEAAAHAHESHWTMTLPLGLLAVFAVGAGWLGIPEEFPLLGGLLPNFFHEFVGGTLLEHPETLAFSIVPLATSLVVALGGLALGWFVYQKAYAAADARDPLEGPLGPLYRVLKNKYYIDEFYDWAFVRPTVWLGQQFFSVILDKTLIDGLLHGVARLMLSIGTVIRDRIDIPVVNRALSDGSGEVVKRFGGEMRLIQTGRVQQYLMVLMAIVLAIGAVLLVPGLGR